MTLQTVRDIPMDAAMLSNYLQTLVNLFFKILPIREGEDRSLGTYMESLQLELLGCGALISALHEDALFLTLVSILQYLIDRPDASVRVYKREVFKAISICNKLKTRYAPQPQTGREG